MEGCPAGDAGPVLNTGGGSDAQGFDYAILPPNLSRSRLMVRTLIKGYPVKDTVSILKIPCQGRDPGSNPGCGASLRMLTANLLH